MPKTESATVDGRPPAQGQQPTPESAQSSGSRWKLRNWPLRWKLAVVLIVPLVTALTFGGLRALTEVNSADEFQNTADQVEVASRLSVAVQALQDERTLALARMANGEGTGDQLQAQFGRVDGAADGLRSAVRGLDLDDETTLTNYEQGLQRLDALPALREKITSTRFPDMAAYVTYTSILDQLVQLGRELNLSVTDRELLRQGTTLQALNEAKEYVARQNALLQIAAGRNGFPADFLERTFAAQASATAATDTFNANASISEQRLYSQTVSGAEIDGRERVVAEAFANAQAGRALNIDRAALSEDGAATTDRMRRVESGLLEELSSQATGLANDATRNAWIFLGVMLAALVATLVLMLMIARAMIKPLRTLRSSALEVAYVRLPETVRRILADPNPIEASQGAVDPVPVYTREEIGEVARSFDVVHERAIRMAAEQALLRENVNGIFVNLSRRSQRLVERQLGVIDRLESDEQDPDQLASLFELDHLATRLRRNGESLLVLSGAGLAKTMAKPVPAADVIGAAVSEIEQYARVEVGSVPEVSVQGRTVNDLVHVLAELLDNATYFSEPETKISVRAVVTRRHALAVQITDRGVGMNEDQIREANERLADPPDLDVSVTRRMGLYVVARLAKRHGIEVRLRENEDIEGGVIARIVVPTELLTSQPQGAEPVPARLFPTEEPEEISSPSSPSNPSLPPLPQHETPSSRPPSDLPKRDPNAPSAIPSTRDVRGDRFASFDGFDSESHETTLLNPANAANAAAEEQAAQAQEQASSPRPRPQAQGKDDGGLTPLEQPISLDDLVGGAKAAGPFLSDGPEPERPAATNDEPRWPAEPPEFETANRNGNGTAERADSQSPLALPQREPRYVPVTPEQDSQAEPAGGDGSALEDDVPTRRLPIYQSVLSRWFSEEAEPEAAGDRPADSGEARMEQAEDQEAAEQSWQSVSDNGWQAAHALLEEKSEEITTAGLPKRVPNAYLVPGSVKQSAGDSFADTTVGKPGQGAIARSADAARNRMMSFQRGYQSGRHALEDTPSSSGEFDSVSSSGQRSSLDNGAKE